MATTANTFPDPKIHEMMNMLDYKYASIDKLLTRLDYDALCDMFGTLDNPDDFPVEIWRAWSDAADRFHNALLDILCAQKNKALAHELALPIHDTSILQPVVCLVNGVMHYEIRLVVQRPDGLSDYKIFRHQCHSRLNENGDMIVYHDMPGYSIPVYWRQNRIDLPGSTVPVPFIDKRSGLLFATWVFQLDKQKSTRKHHDVTLPESEKSYMQLYQAIDFYFSLANDGDQERVLRWAGFVNLKNAHLLMCFFRWLFLEKADGLADLLKQLGVSQNKIDAVADELHRRVYEENTGFAWSNAASWWCLKYKETLMQAYLWREQIRMNTLNATTCFDNPKSASGVLVDASNVDLMWIFDNGVLTVMSDKELCLAVEGTYHFNYMNYFFEKKNEKTGQWKHRLYVVPRPLNNGDADIVFEATFQVYDDLVSQKWINGDEHKLKRAKT